MGTSFASNTSLDEDYIDMEITFSPSKTLRCYSPQSRDFEFQMSSSSTHNETTADELFYNGKLLPLRLTSAAAATAPCTNTTNTPLDSCNISPSESCRASCELNPDDDAFFHWSNQLTSISSSSLFIDNPRHLRHHDRKVWPKKLKQKLKSSRAFLKSLFSKSAADESSADHKYLKIGRRIADIIKNIDKEDENGHRRSFSGAIKPSKCLSSSSSSSSSLSFNSNNNVHELNFLRRDSSATEIEVSIDAAIAHCKKSMQEIDGKGKSVRNLGSC